MLWDTRGVELSEATVSEHLSSGTLRDADDLIVLWHERRGSHFDTYAQRLDRFGTRLLGRSGLAVAEGPGDQIYPRAVLDNDHGMVVTWTEVNYNPFECFLIAQHTDALGGRVWGTDGVELARIPGDYEQALASDGRGAAFAAWIDFRGSIDTPVYGVRITDARSRFATANTTLQRHTQEAVGELNVYWSRDASSLRLVLPQKCNVDAAIYDVSGRMIANLLRGLLDAGERKVAWDLKDTRGHPVLPGIYFAAVRSSCGSRTIRIPIMR
jgi:hypothetical protein